MTAKKAEPKSKIDAAILEVQRAIAPLAKSAKAEVGDKFSYTFVPGEVIVAHGLDALHQHGVSWEPSWEPFDFRGGAWLKLSVRLCHPESGEEQSRVYYMPIKGRGDADKAVSGALTYCKGYAMAALAGIVREDAAKHQPDRRREELGRDSEPQYRKSNEALAALEEDLAIYIDEVAERYEMNAAAAKKKVVAATGMTITRADWGEEAAAACIEAAKKLIADRSAAA